MEIILKSYEGHSLQGTQLFHFSATSSYNKVQYTRGHQWNISDMTLIRSTHRLQTNAQCHCNPCVLLRYAVHLFCTLQHCLTTAHYCAIIWCSINLKWVLIMVAIVTGLQSGWLRNHRSVLAWKKKILLENVLTGFGGHPASYWAPHALSLGFKGARAW